MMTHSERKMLEEIHAKVVKGAPSNDAILKAARKVVDARYYHGDDGWEVLKSAIGELEGIVGRTEK